METYGWHVFTGELVGSVRYQQAGLRKTGTERDTLTAVAFPLILLLYSTYLSNRTITHYNAFDSLHFE